jgi:hypothetical protein
MDCFKIDNSQSRGKKRGRTEIWQCKEIKNSNLVKQVTKEFALSKLNFIKNINNCLQAATKIGIESIITLRFARGYK